MTGPTIQPQKVSFLGFLAVIAIFSICGTLFTNWIGLSPYPIPVLMALFAAASFISGQALENLTLKQSNMVWISGVFMALMTMLSLTPAQPNVAEDSVSSSNVIAVAVATGPTPATPVIPQSNISSSNASSPPQPASHQTTQSSSVAPLHTTIDELLLAFEENQVAASKKFGRPIQVSGKVIRVREALGTGILILASPRSGQEHEFGFSDSGTEKLSDVKPGDTVTVTCPEALEAMSVVIVGGCSNVEVK